jgi:hypothetical protein
LRRYARAAAAIFGLVTGLIGLAQSGASLDAATSGGFVLVLLPLVLLSAANAGLLALGSGAVLLRGDRARLGGRVAGVLLAGAALAYIPLVVVTSPDVAFAAILPAAAAVILLVTTRGAVPSPERPVVGALPAVGRFVLLGVAIAALGWSAAQLAGIAAGGTISGLEGYAGVRAGFTLATVHAALAVVATRFVSGALLAAGALDVALGLWAIPTGPASLLGALLLVGVVLVVLGALAARSHRGSTAA